MKSSLAEESKPRWQFWIDVGGTFTDCLAVSPDGDESFIKVLSSGSIKGQLSRLAMPKNGRSVIDPARDEGVDDFWAGAKFRLLNASGKVVGETLVDKFVAVTGELALKRSLLPEFLESVDGAQNDAGMAREFSEVQLKYELDAGLPAPVLAIHLLQGIPISQRLDDCRVDLGTTRGTNALLTRTGARTALVTSFGFRDFLRIGDQARPKLFELTVRKPEPLFETAIEIDERVLSDGTIERTPKPEQVAAQLQELKNQNINSLAICLMFGYQFPAHEQMVARIAAEVGFQSIRCSSDVAPVIKIISRGETTVLDAYLDPVITDYLNEIQAALSPTSQLRFMTSGGGLVSRNRFSGKDSVLSGPAGGVVGAARIGQQVGFQRVIGFDMGGTSTDVSRFDGDFERTFEAMKAGVRIVTPMLAVETVAAGGGSICWFDGTRLRVGPNSAGADPGPACYGRGGPLAMTDVNLFLGRMRRELFPFPLDLVAVETRLDEIRGQLSATGFPMTRDELSAGLWQIANHNMSSAIQTVSVSKGFDPREYLLVSFGGAGSQHCCGVADNLGMTKILDHPYSSILSAVGIRLADQTAGAVAAIGNVREDFHRCFDLLPVEVMPGLEAQAIADLIADGNVIDKIEIVRSVDLRYAGTESCLTIPIPADSNADDCLAEFYRQHQQQFGYLQNRAVEIVTARVDANVRGNRLPQHKLPAKFTNRSSESNQTIWTTGQRSPAATFHRSELATGDLISGPALIADRHTTTVIDADWQAKVLPEGVLLLEKQSPANSSVTASGRRLPITRDSEFTAPDPVRLEIFNNHFSSIARQMGIALQKTSISVNVKERLDFSCAIFTETGDLVVNAPHIPVHLGAMSETVRSIISLNREVVAGDTFVTNDPYAGGSHLPDVSVVTPVFDPAGTKLWFWVASRSHHAEIGGRAPGSMPAGARCLGEEGVLIQNFRLIEGGETKAEYGVQNSEVRLKYRFDELEKLLVSGPFPSRSPAVNLADVRAQVAANQSGLIQLRKLVHENSFATTSAYMGFIQDAAEQKSRAALRRLADGEFRFADSLDNGATIRVRLEKRNDELTIDFAETDPVLPDNLNANRAIVSAAVMYVMRLLIDEDIPLNEGVIQPVKIMLPACFLNPTPAENPFDSPAIVGGNVETSQRIVDCLLGALGIAAASQGTMNNWLMGNATFGYYETIGGGTGATAEGPGADAVHSHMTNTRLTDPEVLESRYPVVLREFSICRGSGGGSGLKEYSQTWEGGKAEKQRGGDGMIREIEFREPMTVSLLTSRRVSRPFGIGTGAAGAAGKNQLFRRGATEPDMLASRCEIEVNEGDRIRMETPGGGAFGSAR